jgi:integrase
MSEAAWRKAVTAAGCRGLRPHDLRRTCVRNLERAGVPRSAAMKLVGHRTDAVYTRCAIAEETLLREAAEKLDAQSRSRLEHSEAAPATVPGSVQSQSAERVASL